jgi:hypothetical protein
MTDAVYRVTIYERSRPLSRVIAQLGDGPPTPSAGGGGYQVIPLPRRAAVTVWQGRDNPLLMDVPIVLGDLTIPPVTLGGETSPTAFRHQHPTASDMSRLIGMWRPPKETHPPPVLKLRAPGDAVPYQHLPWVLNDFTWGNAVGDNRGQRMLQQLVLQFMEYRPDERLQSINLQKRHKHHHRTHVVRAGETLITIARQYKLKGGWRELGNAQHPPIHDPRNLHIGQKLVIPGH